MTHEVVLMSLRPRRLVAAAAAPALLAGVVAAAPATAAPAAEEPKYKGASYALQTKVSIGGETLLDLMLPDIVTFPSGGDKNLLGLPDELADLATLKVLNASANVKDSKLVANSSTAGLSVLKDVVGAKVLNSDCLADKLKVSGDSAVVGLSLLGTKVPVDPGPNFKIEIPKELEALISGGITIDEQNKLPNGGLQVRALHVELVIAPDALGAALNSTLASVRAVAKQVATAVESVTGQSMDELLAKTEGVKASGGAKADRSVRAEAARAKHAKVAEVSETEVATKQSAPKHARAASVATEQAAVESTDAAAETTTVSKADEAAVARQDAAEQANSEAALAQRAERGAKPAGTSAEASRQQAEEQAAAARAEASIAKGKAEAARAEAAQQAQATSDEQAQTEQTEQAVEVDRKVAAADKVENERAERTAPAKADGASLRTADRAQVRAAAPAANKAEKASGLIALEVIVSEVNCTGAELIVKKQEPKRVLPKTGGGGYADDIAVAGLGLLLAGSAAAFVTRRRSGRHAR